MDRIFSTNAWHEILGPGDKIILKKDYRLAPERTITIFENKTFTCSLYAYSSNKRTIILKSGVQYKISSARAETNGGSVNIRVSKIVGNKFYGFSLIYDCYLCRIDQFSSDCGGLVTIIHQEAVELR